MRSLGLDSRWHLKSSIGFSGKPAARICREADVSNTVASAMMALTMTKPR